MSGARALLRERIAEVITVWDAHDPGLHPNGIHQCPSPCGFRGTEAEWQQHLAGKLGDALVVEDAELELFEAAPC